MAIENMKILHEFSPKHLRMGKLKLKYGKETDEQGKQKRVKMERSQVGTKKMKSWQPNYGFGSNLHRGCYSPKQMNYPMNITYTNNPSTTPWQET